MNTTPAPGIDLDAVIAALPDAITHAMKTKVPHLYDPQVAADLAKDMTARLLHAHQAEVAA
ncbi:hypothetical protein ABZU94_07130 [Streptomyces mirabilis]|uniref:hypothetical protein n=1 Tax=Streptomyces sp. NPDC005388 TaxID=3156717 RepID=UPI0033A9A1C3